jgi:riboflavin synthase
VFTGLIQDVGHVESVDAGADGARCGSRRAGREIAPGDSVAVNGVCLTATAVDAAASRPRR